MWRVVFDTNLFVSSVLVKDGVPAQALQAWREQQFLLVVSPTILVEIRSTLSYDRIRRKYQVTDEDVDGLITLLEQDALMVAGTAAIPKTIPDDPDDEKILACAVNGAADFIVSGDRHLLDLGQFASILIIPVRDFLEELQAHHEEQS